MSAPDRALPLLTHAHLAHDLVRLDEQIAHLRALHAIREVADRGDYPPPRPAVAVPPAPEVPRAADARTP